MAYMTPGDFSGAGTSGMRGMRGIGLGDPGPDIGFGMGDVSQVAMMSTADLERQWSAGVDLVPYGDAVAMRSAAAAVTFQGGSFSAPAMANLQRWDTYVKKLTAVSALSPDQLSQYKASGSYDASTGQVSLTGGGNPLSFGGSLSTPAPAGGAMRNPFSTAPGQGVQASSGSSTTSLLLIAGAGIVALIYIGGKGKIKKRFSNPVRSTSHGIRRVFNVATHYPRKILRKIGI